MRLCLFMSCEKELISGGKGTLWNRSSEHKNIQINTVYLASIARISFSPEACQKLDAMKLSHPSERKYNNRCVWHVHQLTIICACYEHGSIPNCSFYTVTKARRLFLVPKADVVCLLMDTGMSLCSTELNNIPSSQGSYQQVCKGPK